MVQGVADGFGDHGLGRDARELLFEPGFERQHERLTFFLARRPARAGAVSPDRLLDRIERRDALESFAYDLAVGQDGEFVQLIALDDLDDPAARGGGRICDASP
jgi:hypothetical protein